MQTNQQTRYTNEQIPIYKNDILQLFQNKIFENIGKRRIDDYSSLRNEVMSEIGIYNYIDPDLAFLNSWYCTHIEQHFLYKFIDDDSVREIIVHAPDFVQLETYTDQRTDIIHVDSNFYQMSLDVFAIKNQVEWNYSTPFASFYTKIKETSFRATLIHFSTSPTSMSKLFLRRISDTPFSLSSFGDATLEPFLNDIVESKQNIIIAGQTGSGKSSLLTSLLGNVSHEHVVVMEDTHEISSNSKNHTSMLAKNIEGKSLVDYCSYSLRMRPDRIVLGEMRGKETVPFILSMNNGHKGLMSTIHANSAVDTISRLALLFSLYSQNTNISFGLITKLICSNIDYVIFMKHRKIIEIIKILGSENETPFIEQIYSLS
jgi:Flp pilus assembly CpaF family ATPase